MTRHRVLTIAAGAAAVSLAIPASVALRYGADPGYSGGPAGNGQGCPACHTFDTGPGSVALIGAPPRYRPGAVYDLTVRVSDPEQAGAGFEISAENAAGHQGAWVITDPLHTHYPADVFADYVTHTIDGFEESVATWADNGGAYAYTMQWQAPDNDAGPVTLFVSGNAVDNAQAFFGDRYYARQATMRYAVAGDADGDVDVDLADVAVLQRCFDAAELAPDDPCAYLDADNDAAVTLADAAALIGALTGPTTTAPPAYHLADIVRGGRVYDKWWRVLSLPAPTGDHPLYPPEGVQSGSATFRCKECHGWDYKGADGAYGAGSHYTGIGGVFGTTLEPQALYDLLTADPVDVPNGHDMDAYGMTDDAVWDVVRMTLDGTLDTDDHIDADGVFVYAPEDGQLQFLQTCSLCHGVDGTDINFGTPADPEYIGTVASENPWEFLHKVRFGHPGAPMPAFEALQWDATLAAQVGAYAATLPTG